MSASPAPLDGTRPSLGRRAVPEPGRLGNDPALDLDSLKALETGSGQIVGGRAKR